MKRTPITLADGRELIYFDENDDAVRETVDRRELPPPPAASQLRYDPLTDEWVAVAAHRQTRTFLPPANECPLDPSTDAFQTEIPGDYDVVVFENRFPSFSARTVDSPGDSITDLVPIKPGFGRCEVVCFTSDHNTAFTALPPSRVRLVVDAWADRTAELSGTPGIEQVFCFENRGVEIGVTLHHPHGQIYAYPFLPPKTVAMQAAARKHFDATGRNLYADVLAAEIKAGDRVVASNEFWTAYVPAAARWPFEVHLAPHRQVADIPALTSDERDAFALIYLEILKRFDGLFDGPMPYISAWHQAPVNAGRELGYLHLQLFSIRRAPGKLKYLAGSESAMGVFINDVTPEQAAGMLRDVRL
ncbi:galactose-1-phosphate uridylyltransferase [Catenuloplanes indicus]|uniref:Galactose-1-phosphate uridylyltransferase n=1 Tax=Catenuloplanes indicus TaxID=137267 RepID=A0AAE3W0J5_9ACTN|nr:galactose-1-phosphate uridylyltransferase [Catenuloplanes indicus]MDQ0367047.1 UDPglucose--hexose-1-phosphate uridylyltransferase [Catenuloplanes indicus]